jgi:hypothetical protein
MLKKVFLAAAASLVLAGATMTMSPTPAMACHSGCHKAAKAMYPHDRKARHAYFKHCKAHYKVWKKAHKKHHLFGK